jgi:hypothetical protein
MSGQGDKASKDERAARLAAALRENLRKRKNQTRERRAPSGQGDSQIAKGAEGEDRRGPRERRKI